MESSVSTARKTCKERVKLKASQTCNLDVYSKAKVHLCLTKLAPVARNYGKHVCNSDLVVGSWCREHGQAAFAMQMQPFDNLHQHDNRHKSDECLEEVSKVLPVAND